MSRKNALVSSLVCSRRTLALVGLITLVVVVAALVLAQTATKAAPPPLHGPFRFVEMPDTMGIAALADTGQWTPIYTQTFGSAFAGWTLTTSTFLYATPSTLRWDRAVNSQYPSGTFTDTLWSGAYMQYRQTNWTVFNQTTQYTKTMDTWAIFGPVDTQQYSSFVAAFDFYLDAQPGASFGWGTSNDGQTFCGKLAGNHTQSWQHMTFALTPCGGRTGAPVYLAFFFQSSDAETPVGLGAFVDNLVISGAPWNKNYLPVVKRDITPTPTVPAFPLAKNYDFEPSNSTTQEWCLSKTNYSGYPWSAGLKTLGGSSSYYLGVNSTSWLVMQSPHYTTPNNYRITAKFNLLGMNNSLSLADYATAQFGLVFGVNGAPFPPDDKCAWAQYTDGFYRFVIKINGTGTGYKTQVERWDNGPVYGSGFVDQPLSLISRTDWNTLQLDRKGSGIVVSINGAQVANVTDSNYTNGRWFGLFTETQSNIGSQPFESNWDDLQIYNLGN